MVKATVHVGALFLLHAGNKGDEAIFLAFCDRIAKNPRFLSGAWRVQVGGVGPSGFSAHDLPRDREGQEALGLQLFASRSSSRVAGGGSVRNLLGAIGNALAFSWRMDRVFFSGGHWIHDLSFVKHVAISLWFAMLRLKGARTGVFCVGSGPLRRPFSRLAARAAFGRNSLLYFRDPGSQSLFSKLGREQAAVGDDLALLFAPELKGETQNEAKKPRILGISPCAWGTLENIYARNADLENQVRTELRRLTELARGAGWRIAWIPTMNPEDLEFARSLAHEQDEIWDTREVRARDLVRRMTELGAMVSMRLHPAIFAWGLGIPFSSLAYAPKVSAFMTRVGLDRRCVPMEKAGWGEAAWRAIGVESAEAARPSNPPAFAEISTRLDQAYTALGRWIDG